MKKILPLVTVFLSSLIMAQDWNQYKIETLTNQTRITGWTAPQKASVLMDFIYVNKPALCVEIGPFLGSATYPIAKALMFNKQGIVHSIDTWTYYYSGERLAEYDIGANFWKNSNINGDAIYLEFVVRHFQDNLRSYCHPIRLNSLTAAKLFSDSSIDMLYLDGDTLPDYCYEELLLYYSKVKSGGAIWLNRADLESKHRLVEFLMENCNYHKNWSYGIECVLFTKK